MVIDWMTLGVGFLMLMLAVFSNAFIVYKYRTGRQREQEAIIQVRERTQATQHEDSQVRLANFENRMASIESTMTNFTTKFEMLLTHLDKCVDDDKRSTIALQERVSVMGAHLENFKTTFDEFKKAYAELKFKIIQ